MPDHSYLPEKVDPFNEKVKSIMNDPVALEGIMNFVNRTMEQAKQPDFFPNLFKHFTVKTKWQPPASEEYYQRLRQMKEKTGLDLHFIENVLEPTGKGHMRVRKGKEEMKEEESSPWISPPGVDSEESGESKRD